MWQYGGSHAARPPHHPGLSPHFSQIGRSQLQQLKLGKGLSLIEAIARCCSAWLDAITQRVRSTYRSPWLGMG